ncbi:amidase [Bacillus alkalisoli]|uniref:amidase n=1 Tax=Bacillus alkalisoli TaxID=2011008 RepID=UPI000C240E13|nr:amidase family protein [Bacillus alkalisoli]
MKGFNYFKYDGLGLAELVKTKEVKPTEVLDACFNRIEEINPKVNAVVYKMYDKAKVEAAKVNNGTFAGIPLLLKDIAQEIKGEPTTSGSFVFSKYVSKVDSEYAIRMKRAGFNFIGKTNVPELGLVAYTEPTYYGASHNPWNLGHTPGGSSGGAAAAVASGMLPIAGASDGGGSIRIPASFCSLFGLKPTRGRTPVGPSLGRFWQGATLEHVLTRTVRDSAAVLDEIAGAEKGAAFNVPAYEGSYLEAMSLPIAKPLKIAFTTNSPIGTTVDESCKEAVLKTVQFLESLGHVVEEKEAPVDGKKIANSYLTLYFGEVSATLSTLEELLGRKVKFQDVEPATWLLGLLGKTTTAEEFVLSLRAWDKAAYAMETFHETYDFYVTPTTAFPASKIGEHDLKTVEKIALNVTGRMGTAKILKKMGIVDQLAEDSLKRVPFTQLANLTGQPAMSVPVHISKEGLPVGVQFMAARGKEHLLIQMAAQIEQSVLWVGMKGNPMM